MSGYRAWSDYVQASDFAHNGWVAGRHLVGSYSCSLVRIENNPAGHYPDPPVDQFVIQVAVGSVTEAKVDLGARRFSTVVRHGDLLIAPPHTATDYEVECGFSMLMVGLGKSDFEAARAALASGRVADLDPLHDRAHRSALVERLAWALWIEAEDGNPHGALYSDYMYHALAAELVRIAGRQTPRSDAKALSDRHMAIVTSALEDRLHERVTLTDLASLLGMDVYQFSRSFKARTGTTPHQFLLTRRVERARALLTTTPQSLAEIAYACGFSSQAHMTSTFAKHMGVTPGRYRREARE